MKKTFLLGLLMLSLTVRFAIGQQTDVTFFNTFDSQTGNFFFDSDGVTKLNIGTSADGDGAIIQLGYYSSATLANNFGTAGGTDWVALSGVGSANSSFNTTLGDGLDYSGPVSPGLVNSGVSYTSTSSSLPSVGTVISLRIYNSTSSVNSPAKYNAVSNDSWLWAVSAPGSLSSALVEMDLTSTSGLIWEGGVGSEFKTTLTAPAAIPEPTTYALLGMGLLGLVAYRRK